MLMSYATSPSFADEETQTMVYSSSSIPVFLLHGIIVFASLFSGTLMAQEGSRAAVNKSLRFHASFDGTGDAIVAQGDGRIYTVESMARKEWTPGITRKDVSIAKGQGKLGDCLRFEKKSQQVICYRGEAMPYQSENWSGTVSFWMRLDPDKDLEPGYCDPLQITEKAWNNGALFVDFDKDLPRDFRLGVFSDLRFWNPENVPWEKWPVDKRPMVTVKKPGFSRESWKHVAFTFHSVNALENQPATAPHGFKCW